MQEEARFHNKFENNLQRITENLTGRSTNSKKRTVKLVTTGDESYQVW